MTIQKPYYQVSELTGYGYRSWPEPGDVACLEIVPIVKFFCRLGFPRSLVMINNACN